MFLKSSRKRANSLIFFKSEILRNKKNPRKNDFRVSLCLPDDFKRFPEALYCSFNFKPEMGKMVQISKINEKLCTKRSKGADFTNNIESFRNFGIFDFFIGF